MSEEQKSPAPGQSEAQGRSEAQSAGEAQNQSETQGAPERITVEVAYALPHRQSLIALEVDAGCTALEAVKRSGILEEFPEIDLEQSKMGIFSVRISSPETYVMRPGDRVEIYRPLIIDPKEMRRRRAEEVRARREAQEKESAQ